MKNLEALLNGQTKYGAFTSEIKMMDKTIAHDENMFITALVLFELHRYENTPEITNAVKSALDFIEACEVAPYAGIFKFYPDNLLCSKLPIPLQADIDDSALAILLLIIYGRRTTDWARSVIENVFENNRILYNNGHPVWVQPGTFRTWISDNYNNPADCCVNINVLALYAYMGLNNTDVYTGALKAVKLAIKQSALDALHMRQIAPFYAHPREIYESVKRAVYFGADELAFVYNDFRFMESYRTDGISHAVCCNNWGQPLWYSTDLETARLLAVTLPV